MLSIYTLNESEQWDKIVRSFDNYDTYWLSGYVRAFYLHGDGEPILFFYENNGTRGINVVMKRDIAKDEHFKDVIPEGKYFDFATPYGYGGWIIEGEGLEELFTDYLRWVERNHIIAEFVRFHPIIQNQIAGQNFYEVIRLGEVVYMELSSPEVIWDNMTSKNRGHIRKAVKSGISVYNGRYPEIFNKFRELYNSTMDKDNADSYYYFDSNFYRSVLEDLPENAQIFYAELEGKTIAATIILAADGMLNYHLSGSLQEYSSLCATNLLLYKVALWGCGNGFRTLYLGGGVGSGEDSLYKFKRSFYKGKLNHFYIGKKKYNEEIYAELMKIRGEIKSSYFPLYRAGNEPGE